MEQGRARQIFEGIRQLANERQDMLAIKSINFGPKSECNCPMRIKLVGDGCSICNPEYWEDMLDEVD